MGLSQLAVAFTYSRPRGSVPLQSKRRHKAILLGLILNGARARLDDMLKSARHTLVLVPPANLLWEATKLLAS